MYFISQSRQESDINGIFNEGRPHSLGEATLCAARLPAGIMPTGSMRYLPLKISFYFQSLQSVYAVGQHLVQQGWIDRRQLSPDFILDAGPGQPGCIAVPMEHMGNAFLQQGMESHDGMLSGSVHEGFLMRLPECPVSSVAAPG